MSFIFILYIFFIVLNFINVSYITIPFKVQDYTYGDGDKIVLKYLYKDIFVKFLVGSPPQKIHLSACLGEYSTFIASKEVEEFDEATFNKNISQTYEAINQEPDSFFFSNI